MLAVALVAAIAFAGYLAASVFSDVYSGVPASIPITNLTVSCVGDAGQHCDAQFVRLNPGRFYVRTVQPSSSLSIQVQDLAATDRARVLLVRAQSPGRVLIIGLNTDVPSLEVPAGNSRALIPRRPESLRFSQIAFVPSTRGQPIVITEIGLFENDAGLLRSERQPFPRVNPQRLYATYAVVVVIAIVALVVVAAWLAPAFMRRAGPWVLAALCGSVCILELGTTFSPYWSRDIRAMCRDAWRFQQGHPGGYEE